MRSGCCHSRGLVATMEVQNVDRKDLVKAGQPFVLEIEDVRES